MVPRWNCILFFTHNENILAKRECRHPNPVSTHYSSTETDSTECSGLLISSGDSSTEQPLSCSCRLKDIKYTQLQHIFCTLSSHLDEETLSMWSLLCIEAFTILKKAISCESIVEKGPVLVLNNGKCYV